MDCTKQLCFFIYLFLLAFGNKHRSQISETAYILLVITHTVYQCEQLLNMFFSELLNLHISLISHDTSLLFDFCN